jgi:hypothetical protein
MTMHLDQARIAREMRILAEARVDQVAGKNALVLSKKDTAKIFGRSIEWVRAMIVRGRLPAIRIGNVDMIQRPVAIEALIRGV